LSGVNAGGSQDSTTAYGERIVKVTLGASFGAVYRKDEDKLKYMHTV